MAPSHLQNFSPADLTWHLLACNIFYRQICDGTFSPAICFTARFAMAPSHLQNFSPADLRWRLLACNILYRQICDGAFSPAICFTARFAMAPSHLQNFSPADLAWHLLACNMFYGQRLLTCNILYLQICDGAFSPATCFTARFAMAPSHLQYFVPADLT